MTRSIYQIAKDIRTDWSKQSKGVNYAARPYLDAMFSLDKLSDSFGADSGKSVVLYFLSNSSTYRGDAAKRLKVELKELLK